MKKIISIILTLLFVASVLSFGTAMAGPLCAAYCEEKYYDIPTTVRVGQVVSGWIEDECTYGLKIGGYDMGQIMEKIDKDGFPVSLGPIELLSGAEEYDDGWTRFGTFRGVYPGTLVIEQTECKEKITIRVLPRSLPMHSLMRILGFGGLMRE